MRILLINKFYYIAGGVERYVLEWERMLKGKGHEVIIFSMKDLKNNESCYSKYFIDNVNFTANGSVSNRLKSGINSIYSVEAKRNMECLIKDTKPDIAHIHAFCYQLTPSILFPLKEANIPVVLTSHEYKPICPNQRLFNLYKGEICEDCEGKKYYYAVANRCMKKSLFASLLGTIEAYLYSYLDIYNNYIDIIITPSLFMRNKFLTNRVKKEEQIVHVPNFINIEEYTPNLSYNGLEFAYCGRIDGNKGIETLIRACKQVNNGRLLIVGEGEWKTKIEDLIEKEKIQNVSILGYKKGNELFEIINRCLFTVLPSECYENGPFAILESMVLGRSVVGSKIGGIPEIISDGVDGLLFEPHNVGDLANKIRYLIDNKDIVSEMGKRARRKVEERYNSDLHYERLMEVYEQVMTARRMN